MYILLVLIVFFGVYINSFKEDFTKEQVSKVALAVGIAAFLFILLGILSSALKS